MKIMKRQAFMLPTGKRQGYRFAGYFVYGMAYYSVITALLTGRLFISPVAAVVIFLLCLDVVLCSKTL
jgi:hypothetical protein